MKWRVVKCWSWNAELNYWLISLAIFVHMQRERKSRMRQNSVLCTWTSRLRPLWWVVSNISSFSHDVMVCPSESLKMADFIVKKSCLDLHGIFCIFLYFKKWCCCVCTFMMTHSGKGFVFLHDKRKFFLSRSRLSTKKPKKPLYLIAKNPCGLLISQEHTHGSWLYLWLMSHATASWTILLFRLL